MSKYIPPTVSDALSFLASAAVAVLNEGVIPSKKEISQEYSLNTYPDLKDTGNRIQFASIHEDDPSFLYQIDQVQLDTCKPKQQKTMSNDNDKKTLFSVNHIDLPKPSLMDIWNAVRPVRFPPIMGCNKCKSVGNVNIKATTKRCSERVWTLVDKLLQIDYGLSERVKAGCSSLNIRPDGHCIWRIFCNICFHEEIIKLCGCTDHGPADPIPLVIGSSNGNGFSGFVPGETFVGSTNRPFLVIPAVVEMGTDGNDDKTHSLVIYFREEHDPPAKDKVIMELLFHRAWCLPFDRKSTVRIVRKIHEINFSPYTEKNPVFSECFTVGPLPLQASMLQVRCNVYRFNPREVKPSTAKADWVLHLKKGQLCDPGVLHSLLWMDIASICHLSTDTPFIESLKNRKRRKLSLQNYYNSKE